MQTENATLPQDGIPDALYPVMLRIAGASVALARRISRNGLDEGLGHSVGTNADGDGQKALDVIADEAFRAALTGCGIRHYASEEQEEVLVLDPEGSLALAIDPLDGSSNIEVDVSIGTIFSIYPAAETPQASFLRPAKEQIAAGYVIYGPQCCLLATFGDGVRKWVLDREAGRFVMVESDLRLPAVSSEFAVNASNYRHWAPPIRAYIDDCIAGAEGPRRKNFNMRWVASLVAETHRILTRGGVFLYPGDRRKGYEHGRLRMVYECAPIAFLAVQAGGGATDGADPILNMQARSLHARTPFVFGSHEKVARIAAYHDMPKEESHALFGQRGLFRT